MQCPHCAATFAADCRYCPQCGRTTDSTLSEAPAQNADEILFPGTESAAAPRRAATYAPSPRSAPTVSPEAEVNGLLTRANLHRLRNEWKEATDCCVAVLRLQSANHTAHSLLGDLYRDQGRLDDAIQWYRMALDLHANPSDEAKLIQAERERNQLMAEDAQRHREGYGSALTPALAAVDADLNAGTVNLMGVSPHRWIHGIWITTLSFLLIFLVVLINTHPAHRPTTGRGNTPLSAATPGNGSLLPPVQQPSGSTLLSPTDPGIRSDLFSGNQGAPQTHLRAPEPPPILQTAPVVNVAPLPANGLVNAPRDASARPALQPMPLTGGLSLERAQSVGDGTVAVLVSAPEALAVDGSQNTRDLLLRNLYRAARTGLAGSETYTRATVFIQVPATGDTGEVAVMEATVSRENATNSKPDTESIESLTSHLTGLKWSGQNAAPPTTAPATQEEGATPAQDSSPPGQ